MNRNPNYDVTPELKKIDEQISKQYDFTEIEVFWMTILFMFGALLIPIAYLMQFIS